MTWIFGVPNGSPDDQKIRSQNNGFLGGPDAFLVPPIRRERTDTGRHQLWPWSTLFSDSFNFQRGCHQTIHATIAGEPGEASDMFLDRAGDADGFQILGRETGQNGDGEQDYWTRSRPDGKINVYSNEEEEEDREFIEEVQIQDDEDEDEEDDE